MDGLRVEQLATRHLGPLDFSIATGECVCLSGPSGAGKTLTLRAIADLDPHQGKIALDEEAATAMSGPAWRRHVGLLPAESQWWRETVGEHFPEYEETWWRALDFDRSVMGWSVSRLSTGERQRLALLRLLANRPRVLLLDEPTASLDHENVERAEALIADYRRDQNAAVLWVSHDPAQIKRVADRQLRFVDGRLEAAG